MDLDTLQRRVAPWLPVRAGAFDLDLLGLEPAEGAVEDRAHLHTIKEQPVRFLRASQVGDPRVVDAVQGWAHAFETAAVSRLGCPATCGSCRSCSSSSAR